MCGPSFLRCPIDEQKKRYPMASNTFLLSHYFQAPQGPETFSGKDAESEFRGLRPAHGVEYVGLNAFEVFFQVHWRRRNKSSDPGCWRTYASQFLTDLREAFQHNSMLNSPHIRLSTAVYADDSYSVLFFLVCQQGNFAEFGQHLRRTETHAVHIEIHGALDSAVRVS